MRLDGLAVIMLLVLAPAVSGFELDISLPDQDGPVLASPAEFVELPLLYTVRCSSSPSIVFPGSTPVLYVESATQNIQVLGTNLGYVQVPNCTTAEEISTTSVLYVIARPDAAAFSAEQVQLEATLKWHTGAQPTQQSASDSTSFRSIVTYHAELDLSFDDATLDTGGGQDGVLTLHAQNVGNGQTRLHIVADPPLPALADMAPIVLERAGQAGDTRSIEIPVPSSTANGHSSSDHTYEFTVVPVSTLDGRQTGDPVYLQATVMSASPAAGSQVMIPFLMVASIIGAAFLARNLRRAN